MKSKKICPKAICYQPQGMIQYCMIFEGFLYCLGSTVAQAISDCFAPIFVHIRTTENIAITHVIAVNPTAVMSLDAYRVNIIS